MRQRVNAKVKGSAICEDLSVMYRYQHPGAQFIHISATTSCQEANDADHHQCVCPLLLNIPELQSKSLRRWLIMGECRGESQDGEQDRRERTVT